MAQILLCASGLRLAQILLCNPGPPPAGKPEAKKPPEAEAFLRLTNFMLFSWFYG